MSKHEASDGGSQPSSQEPGGVAAQAKKLRELKKEASRIMKVVDVDPDSETGAVFGLVSKDISALETLVKGSDDFLFVREFEDRPRGKLSKRMRLDIDSDLLFLGDVWGKSFTLWRSLVDPFYVRVVNKYLNVSKWDDDASLYKKLKALTELVKKYADYVQWREPLGWQFLVHLELFGGFMNSVDPEEMLADVQSWTAEEVDHTATTGDYNAIFSSVLAGWFKPTKPKRDALSFNDWLSMRWTWARSGSSTTYLGKGVPKTKWHLAWVMSDKRLMDIMLGIKDVGQIKHTLIQKLELGKVRGVIGVDDALYLAMAYISEFVEDDLSGTKMFNFLSFDMQLKAMEHLAQGEVLVPLDESKFDHNKSASAVRSCVAAIGRFALNRNKGNDEWDLRACINFVDEFIYGGVIHVGAHAVRVLKGVLSGWRWTYLIDTMINVNQVEMCLLELRRMSVPVTLWYICSGDDVGATFPSIADASVFISQYSTYGYEINPGKFWVSNSRNEFLRLTVTRNGVRGYMPRQLPRMLFGSPQSDDFVDKVERVRSLPSSWSKIVVRGAKRDVAMAMMYRDLAGILGTSVSLATRWAHTPVAYGGGGCWPPVMVGITMIEDQAETESTVRAYDFPGVVALSNYVTRRYQVKADEEQTVTAVLNALFKGTASMSKLEKVQNGFRLREVWIPPPHKYGRSALSRTPPQVVPRELSALSSEIINSYFNEFKVPERMLNKPVLEGAMARKPGWSKAALKLWLMGKQPTSTLFFKGHDSVRIREAARVLIDTLTVSTRMTVETMRSLGAAVAYSSAFWSIPADIWME